MNPLFNGEMGLGYPFITKNIQPQGKQFLGCLCSPFFGVLFYLAG
jgi:hypothetical protein